MNRADFVEVDSEKQRRIELLRAKFHNLFDDVDVLTQSSRETSLGYTKLEEALFWFVKGISREVESKEDTK